MFKQQQYIAVYIYTHYEHVTIKDQASQSRGILVMVFGAGGC